MRQGLPILYVDGALLDLAVEAEAVLHRVCLGYQERSRKHETAS